MTTREELMEAVEDARVAMDDALDEFEADDALDNYTAALAALIAYDKENT